MGFTKWLLSDESKKLKLIISGVSLVLLLLQVFCASLRINHITAILLAFVVLPWAGHFLEEFEFGVKGLKGKFKNTEANRITLTTPSSSIQFPTLQELSNDAQKILATLWSRQQAWFGVDTPERWSFRVLPGSPQYTAFINGFLELLRFELVAVAPKNNHCLLTNKGIDYIKNNPPLQEREDVYSVKA